MLNLNNWNRLFFSVDKKNYYVSFQNYEFEQERIDWLDYKKIKFIDITHSNRHAAFYSFQSENDICHFVENC